MLVSSTDELLENLGWKDLKKPVRKKQRELFIEINTDERRIIDVLRDNRNIHIDELHFKTGLSSSAMACALLTLEMQGLIISQPGKMYALDS